MLDDQLTAFSSLGGNFAVVARENGGGPRRCACNSTFDGAEGVMCTVHFGFCELHCPSRKRGDER